MEKNTRLDEKYKAIETELEEFKQERSTIDDILKTELQLVGEALDLANQEVGETCKEIGTLRHTLTSKVKGEKNQQCTTLNAKIGDLERVLTSKEQYVTELKKSLQGAKREFEEHKQQTEEQIKDYLSQLDTLIRKKKAKNKNEHLRTKVTKLQREKKKLETVKDSLKTELSKVEKVLEKEKKKLDIVKEKHKSQLNKVHSDFESEKKTIVTENDKLITELNKYEKDLESEKKKLDVVNEKHKSELDKVQTDFESEKKEFETINDTLKTKLNKAQEELNSEKKKIVSLSDKLKNVLRVQINFQSQNKKLETVNDKLKTELIEVQKELLYEKKKVETIHHENKAELTKFQNESKIKVKQLEDLNIQLRAEVVKLINDFEREKKIVEIIHSGNKNEVTKLYAELENEKRQLENVNIQVKTEIATLIDDCEKEKKRVESEHCQLKADAGKHLEESHAKDEQIRELTESLKTVESRKEAERELVREELKKTEAQLDLLKGILQQTHDKIGIQVEENTKNSKSSKPNRNAQSSREVIIKEEDVLVKQEPETNSEEDGYTDDYKKLIDYGLNKKVAAELAQIYKSGKLVHADLEEWIMDNLKNFPVEATLKILRTFLDGTLDHVTDMYGYLCDYMKDNKEKKVVKEETTCVNGPNEENIQKLLKNTGYSLRVTSKYRQFGGPPPGCPTFKPVIRDIGYELTVSNIPPDVYEDELVPILKLPAMIWSLRLMMNPATGQHTGIAYVIYYSRQRAETAAKEVDNYKMRDGSLLKVSLSVPSVRLFIGNVPLHMGHEELLQLLRRNTDGLVKVFYFNPHKGDTLCELFRVLEYESLAAAFHAKRKLENPKYRLWSNRIVVDWHNENFDKNIDIAKRGLCITNIRDDVSEQMIRNAFELFGMVKVKKGHVVTFVDYSRSEDAMKAMEMTNGTVFFGAELRIQLIETKWDRIETERLMIQRFKRMNDLMERLNSSGHGVKSEEKTIVSRNNFRDNLDKSECAIQPPLSNKKIGISFEDSGSNSQNKHKISGHENPSSISHKMNENCVAKRKLESTEHDMNKKSCRGLVNWSKDSFEGVVVFL